MSVREQFVEQFGEAEAAAVEAAAEEHAHGINDKNRGSDPFKWALLIAIGYQCMETDHYRESHGIFAPWESLRDWMIESADLGSHDGDSDMLALFAGAYNAYVKELA